MDKTQLLKMLTDWKYAAYYNIFSQQCLHEYFKHLASNKSEPFPIPGLDLLDHKKLSLLDFVSMLDDKYLLKAKRSANTFITRNWLKETFRLVQSYANNNKIKLINESWYDFARLYVNAYSHNYKFQFSNYDKSILPVSYNSAEITLADDGKSASLKMQVAYELVEDIIKFAEESFQISE